MISTVVAPGAIADSEEDFNRNLQSKVGFELLGSSMMRA